MPLSDHGSRLGWVVQAIHEKKIFVPNIKKMNDPFEKLLEAYIREASPPAHLSPKLYKLAVEQGNQLWQCCSSFSKEGHTRALLWSHYADSWKGIRLVFKQLEMHKLNDVHYYSNLEDVTDIHTPLKILRKLEAWSYEKECRFF